MGGEQAVRSHHILRGTHKLIEDSIFFSKGFPQSLKQDVKNLLDVHNESLSEKYLGMPTQVGH